MTDLIFPAADSVDQFGESVTREWYYDRRLVVYTVTDFSREVVDEWFEATAQTMREWPKDRTYYSIHDFTNRKVGYSPYSSSKAKALLQLGRELRLRGPLTIALSSSMIHRLMANMVLRTATRKLQLKFVFSRQSAFEWVVSIMLANEGDRAAGKS